MEYNKKLVADPAISDRLGDQRPEYTGQITLTGGMRLSGVHIRGPTAPQGGFGE